MSWHLPPLHSWLRAKVSLLLNGKATTHPQGGKAGSAQELLCGVVGWLQNCSLPRDVANEVGHRHCRSRKSVASVSGYSWAGSHAEVDSLLSFVLLSLQLEAVSRIKHQIQFTRCLGWDLGPLHARQALYQRSCSPSPGKQCSKQADNKHVVIRAWLRSWLYSFTLV